MQAIGINPTNYLSAPCFKIDPHTSTPHDQLRVFFPVTSRVLKATRPALLNTGRHGYVPQVHGGGVHPAHKDQKFQL